MIKREKIDLGKCSILKDTHLITYKDGTLEVELTFLDNSTEEERKLAHRCIVEAFIEGMGSGEPIGTNRIRVRSVPN